MRSFVILVYALATCGNPLDGIWSGNQTVVTSTGLSTVYPILSLTVTGTQALLKDSLACSSGCYIDSTFSYTGSSFAGWYRVGSATAAIHGAWSMFVDGSLLRGLTTSFSSGRSYIILCQRVNLQGSELASSAPLDGSWLGTESRISSSGIGTTSPLSMNMTGKFGYFVDQFGCGAGCYLTSDYAYTGNAMIGYYHDGSATGKVHGIWQMNIDGNSIFAFTTSYQSGYSYIVNWKPTPPCGSECSVQTRQFTTNCGAWIVWRPLFVDVIHQAFTYDNNYKYTTPPSFQNTSGYYCCGDNHQSGTCDDSACSSSSFLESVDVTLLGRVCGDSNPSYQNVLSSAGLSSNYPDQQSKTCWFLDPSKNQFLNCSLLWQAERQIQPNWNECENFVAPPYSLTSRNCRYYVSAVMTAYCTLVGKSASGCTC